METLNTNSNDCLNECKELIRKHISSSSLKIDCEDIISVIQKPLDANLFKGWLDRNIGTFISKTNIQTYFKKAFINEMFKGTFDVKEPNTNPHTLIEALRNKGVIITSSETLFLDIMWRAYLKRGMKIEDIQKLNNQIVNYMQKGEAFEDYVSYVKRSKTTKPYDVDWGTIQKEYDQEITTWEDLISLKDDDKDFEFEDDDWTKNLEETIRIAKTKLWGNEEDDE